MKKILITNDDGIFADGILRLAEIAKDFGEVWVVAPDGERSAMSHSVTLKHSFSAWKVDFPISGVHAFACDGQPADCVRIGVLNIVPGKPDCVLSGINFGYNTASDLQYSATVGAAFEASYQGIHAIAFSEDMKKSHDVTDYYLKDILGELLEKPLGPGQIWNVNFPCCPLEECRGVLRDRTVSPESLFTDSYTETKLSEDRISFMVSAVISTKGMEGTDLGAVLDNYVSVGIACNIT